MSTSTSISTTTTNSVLDTLKTDPLYQVVNAYLDTVKTKSGKVPNQTERENFLLTAVSYKLNPIKKQIFLLGYDRKNGEPSFSEIVAASGFTAIASRTGEFAGIDQPRFTYNGKVLDSCSVTVYRLINGQRCPFTGNAYYSERAFDNFGVKSAFKEQPKTMLEKCARAAALRIAFPEELGNKYDIDEMPREEMPKAVIIDNNSKTETTEIDIEKQEILKTLKGFFYKLEKGLEIDTDKAHLWLFENKDKISESDFEKITNLLLEKDKIVNIEPSQITDEKLANFQSIPEIEVV